MMSNKSNTCKYTKFLYVDKSRMTGRQIQFLF